MLTYQEVDELLNLHSTAYKLLMWLADEATKDPQVLSPKVVAALREPDTAAKWLEVQRMDIPEALVCHKSLEQFAGLLSSFFFTSFQVRHLEFEGRLVESRVTLGVADTPSRHGGLELCQVLALRHLASAEKLPFSERDTRILIRRKSLREASLLWTYIWELDRRAKWKGKGTVVHKIWNAIPKNTRTSLNAERIWVAREQLLEAVTKYLEDATVDMP